VERQDKFRLSDAAARARVDSFNNSRAQMGISNALKVAETGARIYGAAMTGGASLGVEAALAAAKAKQQSDQNKTSTAGLEEYANTRAIDQRGQGFRNAMYGAPSDGRGLTHPNVRPVTSDPFQYEDMSGIVNYSGYNPSQYYQQDPYTTKYYKRNPNLRFNSAF